MSGIGPDGGVIGAEDDTIVHGEEGAPEGPPLPSLGDSLGRYQLQEILGQGGMGVVYRAYDPSLRRAVALKLVRPELPADVRKRFFEEAQVTAQLQHPVIIPVFEVGSAGDYLYYTMPLVRGVGLDDLIAASQGWSFRLLQVLVTVCRAVGFAHRRGVLHRDLKPSNVMVGDYGEVYVLDWGLAKVFDPEAPPLPSPRGASAAPLLLGDRIEALADRDQTAAGVVVGTPVYMAPEQAIAQGEQVGPAADVYCLGGILYQLLTGQPPRTGTRTAIVRALAEPRAAPPPSELRAGVPKTLEAIAMRALELDPRQRYAAGADMAEALEAYLEGRTVDSAGETSDDAFLANYSAMDFRRPSVTVDVLLLARTPAGRAVALIQRANPPCQGAWALPGTFVDLEEGLEASASRVLAEKLGVSPPQLIQAGAFGEPGRDPRTRVITVVYRGELEELAELGPGARWFVGAPGEGGALELSPLGDPPLTAPVVLAFDHADVLRQAWPSE
ncbi:MAG TPA: hypothetical protein DEA08_25695 [Planctomycetes bacterium]|nr:hypothetical protein [Planctomycetota bacterium]